MVKDQRWQIYPNVVQCLTITLFLCFLDGLADFVRCLACYFLCRRLWRSHADSDVFWLNSVGALICGIWFSKESICSSFCWAFGYCRKPPKAAKTLPCCVRSARKRSCMSSDIVWRIYVGFVVDIDIKILGVPPPRAGHAFLWCARNSLRDPNVSPKQKITER
jgi:hypothetical protein